MVYLTISQIPYVFTYEQWLGNICKIINEWKKGYYYILLTIAMSHKATFVTIKERNLVLYFIDKCNVSERYICHKKNITFIFS